MAQQFYKPQHRREEDDDGLQNPLIQQDGGNNKLQEASDRAQQSIDNIDNVLRDNDTTQIPSHSGTSSDLLQQENEAARESGGSTGTSQSSPRDLKQSESSVDSPNNNLNYTGGSKPSSGKMSKRKKRAAIGGGIVGVLFGGGLFGVLGPAAGPLQFIHWANFEHNAHMAAQENAGDGRFGKMSRWFRSGLDSGSSRLGFLSEKINAKTIDRMKKIGLEPKFGPNKTYTGFAVDQTSPDSPFHGLNDEEVRIAFHNLYGIDLDGSGGKPLSVSSDKFWGGQGQRAQVRALLKSMGYSKLSTALRVRFFNRYGLVSWHPMVAFDKAVNKVAIDLFNRAFGKGKGTTIDTTKAQSQDTTTDQNGKPVTTTTDIPGEVTTPTASQFKDQLAALQGSTSVKLAGGVAAVAAIVCTAKAVNDRIGEIRFANVILPLVTLGWTAVTTGHQIQFGGNDVNTGTMEATAKHFTETDINGKVLSTVDQAASIQYEAHQTPTGPDIDPAVRGSFQPNTLFSWTANPAVGALCSGAGTIITTVGSVVIGVLTGAAASTALGLVAGIALGPSVVDGIARLVAGETLDPKAAGSKFGNYMNWGVRLAGSLATLPFGGSKMTNSQTLNVKALAEADQLAEFQSQSLAYRMFDLSDYRSFASHVIDSQATSPVQEFASMGSKFMHIGSSLMRMPASLVTSTVHAAPAPYDYGFAMYGFCQQDLDNAAFDNPYINSDLVTGKTINGVHTPGILDGPRSQELIDRAQKAYGVTITKMTDEDGKQRWDVVPGEPPNVYDDKNAEGNRQDCQSPDTDWQRMRFFVFDTGISEGQACSVLSDKRSCANDGYNL